MSLITIAHKAKSMKKHLVLNILGLVLIFGVCIAEAAAQGNSASAPVAPGAAAPDFSLPDAVSGNTVSLADYKGQKAVVLIFTSNYCPYSRLYETRIQELIKKYKGQGVAFLMINSNDPEQHKEESEASMKEKAEGWGVPYLSDKKQVAAKKYGASKTPEVFILSPRTGTFTVFYAGAIDDNPQVAEDVSQPYVQQALDGILTGKTVAVKAKRPVGCMIKVKE